MKYILLFGFICIFFQPTAFSMFQKYFKSPKIKDAITQNFSKSLTAMTPPIANSNLKIIKKSSYSDTISKPEQNQNLWSKITSKIKSWLMITPKVVDAEALNPGSFADLRIKQDLAKSSKKAAGNNMYPKIKQEQKNLFTPIGRRWYSTYKDEDKKFQSKYNNFTKDDFIEEFGDSNNPENLYRDLLKIYHPDLQRFSAEFCEEKTKDINNAFREFKEFKKANKSTKKEGPKENKKTKDNTEGPKENKKTKDNTEGPIEDVNVKSNINQKWFKQKAEEDRLQFNRENDLSYRAFFSTEDTFFYYQIDLNSDNGSIKTAKDLTYKNETFIPTNAQVSEKYQKEMLEGWLKKQMNIDKYYFNNKYKLKGKLRHIIENKYYELTLKKENGKVTTVTCLQYKEGEFVPTTETITQKTYQELAADGFSFDESNTQFATSMSSSKFDKEALEKLMRNDAYDFNAKNNAKFRKIQYNGDELPRYYEFIINLNNGTYTKVIELIYKDGNFVERENEPLPSKETLDDLFYFWIEDKMDSDQYNFNKPNKDKFRYIIQHQKGLFNLINIFAEFYGKKKREHPEPGYYEAVINIDNGIITKIVKLAFNNNTFILTNKVSTDEKIYKEIHNNWMKFIIRKDMESFNEKHQNKQRNLYTSDPIQYYEAEFDIKNGTVIEAYWLDYKNSEFVKSTRKISQDELKKIYQIGSKNK